MGYRDNPYEDELDRMRARQQRKGHRGESRRPAFGWDDTIVYHPNYNNNNPADSDESADFEDFDLDEDWDLDDPLLFEDFDLDEQEPKAAAPVRKRGGASSPSGKRPAPQSGRSQKSMKEGNRPVKPSSGKKPKRRKKGGMLFKLVCLVVLLTAGSFLFRYVRSGGYWTVAVFGVDSRDGNVDRGALSDVEMLCSINKKTGEIRLTSVFRDSYLCIDQDDRYDKINEAYFLGGHKQAVSALEDNFDLQIDDYATFNWKAVVDAINILGGVDIEITDKEFAYINSFITETVESTGVGSHHLESSGMNHLDGVQAVAYARLRLMDTDFNRTERQRKVLGLAMEKAKSADTKTLISLVQSVYPQVSTSIGIDDLLGMAKNAKKYYIGQTSGFPFSHQEIKISKKSCVVPTTLESNVIQLHKFLYDTEQYAPSKRVQEISSHIIEVSGLGEPGKDTESGKNVGAEGNSGGGSANPGGSSSEKPQTEAAPETEAPAETESTAESEPESESSPESSAEETIAPLESAETDETDKSESEPKETSADSESTQKFPESSLEAPGNQKPETPESSKGPGASEKPQGSSKPAMPEETNGILEAPGQNQTSEETLLGPGVS